MLKIFHNPRCSKSRGCLAYLDELQQPYEVVNYLKDIPTAEELKWLIAKLHLKPIDIVRQKEPIWLEKYAGRKLSDHEIINAMITDPILIERPIIVNGDKAVIGRPIENVDMIL